MNEALTYIDDFFRGTPGPDEKKEFEKRLQEDPAFAEEVAFYVATINVLKEDAHADRRERFRNFRSVAPAEDVEEDIKVKPMRNSRRLSWMYAAAASMLILLTVGWWVFGNRETPQEMCDNYINKEFKELRGTTMGGTQDSLQLALDLYNSKGKPNEALQIFLDLDAKDSTVNSELKKNIGIVYLKLGDYDKALEYFKQLKDINGLRYNPGEFLQAITLLKRNQSGDAELAKKYLQHVDEVNLGGSDEAKKILDSY